MLTIPTLAQAQLFDLLDYDTNMPVTRLVRTGEPFRTGRVMSTTYRGSHIAKYMLFAALAVPLLVNAYPEITIRKDQTGHFNVMGAINGIPTYFIIDTGATITAVPPSVANKTGLTQQRCRLIATSTANGITHGCSYSGQISLGEISVEGEIHVLPNLKMNLLGMNVLGGLNIHQSDQFMTLTKGDVIPSSISITPVNRSTVVLPANERMVKRLQTEIDDLKQFRAKVRGLLIVPDNILGNPHTTVRVIKLSTGEVTDVTILRSSGQSFFDQAVVKAVQRASPFSNSTGTGRVVEMTIDATESGAK